MIKPTFASLSPASLFLFSSLFAAACVSRAPIANAPCPCPAGSAYVCCNGLCTLPTADTCPGSPSTGAAGNPLPPTTGLAGNPPMPTTGAAGNGPPAGVVTNPFVSVGIGAAHACAVRQDGSIKCEGANDKGQSTPPPNSYYQVVAGWYHTCGQIKDLADRHVDLSWVCWGDNTYGQTNVPPGPMGQVSAGEKHTCGIGSGAQIVCWGDNSLGQLEAPPSTGQWPTTLAAGRNHTCAVVPDAPPPDGGPPISRIACWGDNSSGQSAPPPDLTVDPLATMAAGGDHTCLANNLRGVTCWGANDQGQSVEPAGFIEVLSLASGHSCLLRSVHQDPAFCWGTGWGTSISTPPTDPANYVYAGDYINCVMPADQTKPMLCWGQTYEPWY
jgi:hypothetical protein